MGNCAQYMEQEQKKVCNSCKKELYISAFYKKRRGKYGVTAICKVCNNIKDKERYYKDIEKSREKGRQKNNRYYEINKEKINGARRLSRSINKPSEQERKKLGKLRTLHQWVKRCKPKLRECSICNEVKRLELSNISGEYKRDISDYWWLCHSCHCLFDRINKTHKEVV